MRILCLTTRPDRPSTRYRWLQYLPYLKQAGVEAELAVIPKGFNRWRMLRAINGVNAVFIQKKLFSRLEQVYIGRKARTIIYDFDDAIMYTPVQYGTGTRRYKRFCSMAAAASHIIAGNRYLAAAVPADRSGKVTVIPTVVDVTRYPVHKRGGPITTIGWIGTSSTQQYLEKLKPVFSKITGRYSGVTIKVISDRHPGMGNIVWEQWNADREMDQLLSIDIGIMPLDSNPWTEGKCGFKIIQYMAAGIPVVCSPVGVNKEVVTDSVNGLHADSIDQWEQSLSRLIEDKVLYDNMAAAGRKTADSRYNLQTWGPYFADFIKECIC